jgi:hypothetical protein
MPVQDGLGDERGLEGFLEELMSEKAASFNHCGKKHIWKRSRFS